MNVSVCITVLNEEKSIGKLLDSLLCQSKKADEIIIVDGESEDKTIDIIKHYQKKDKRIRYLVEPGTIAHGRNVSIDVAKGDIVALTDAGCIAKPDWLEKLVYPFKHENVGIVAGFYDMPASTPMNQAINVFHGVPQERFNSINFLPSARSVAFRKEVWDRIGGFDEKLERAGEDTKFFYEAVRKSVKIVRVKEARVVWQECADFSLKDSIEKMYYYAKGDSQAKIWWHPSQQLSSHNIIIFSIFFRYFVGIVLLIYSFTNPPFLYLLLSLLIFYLIWSILKWKDVVRNWRGRLWLPIVQITGDLAVMSGFIGGIFQKK